LKVQSGLRRECDKGDLHQMLSLLDCLEPTKWPSGVESPWYEDERRLDTLCKKFQIDFTNDILMSFRDYIDNPASTPEQIVHIKAIANSMPVSSSDCERGFSAMNNVCSDLRNKLSIQHISELVFISSLNLPISIFNPTSYVKTWLTAHRSADDNHTKKLCYADDERYKRLWPIFD